MAVILLGTHDGVVTFELQRNEWREQGRSLAGHDVWVIGHCPGEPGVIYAGTYGDGLYCSRDGGGRWDHCAGAAGMNYVRSVAFNPVDARTVYVGAEPANVFSSGDGGESWIDLGVRSLPEAPTWSLPYSPRGGAVRSLVLHPARPSVLHGGLEQGGVLQSLDGGATWSITRDGVHPDVHSLSVHPGDPHTIFAATGGGLYLTRDATGSWDKLVDDYTRAVAVHPTQPRLVFAGPARRVGSQGRILASQDGGESWVLAARGFDLPMASMVESFVMHPRLENDVFAVLANGRVYHSHVDGIDWRPFGPPVEGVKCMDVAA